jgi:hypothetical protein
MRPEARLKLLAGQQLAAAPARQASMRLPYQSPGLMTPGNT